MNCVRWSNSGQYLASGGDDKLVMIWQLSRYPGGKLAFQYFVSLSSKGFFFYPQVVQFLEVVAKQMLNIGAVCQLLEVTVVTFWTWAGLLVINILPHLLLTIRFGYGIC